MDHKNRSWEPILRILWDHRSIYANNVIFMIDLLKWMLYQDHRLTTSPYCLPKAVLEHTIINEARKEQILSYPARVWLILPLCLILNETALRNIAG